MAHPRAVTGIGCAMCDGGPCKVPWHIEVPPDYPLLPKEMVDAMQPAEPKAPAPPTAAELRAKRLAEDRKHRPVEDRAHKPVEDR